MRNVVVPAPAMVFEEVLMGVHKPSGRNGRGILAVGGGGKC
jgi:hypothetical protein